MGILNKFFGKRRNVADKFVELRNMALSLNPGQVGLQPDAAHPVFGVLMETVHDDTFVTLVAIGEGSVSLYFSNGGGIIGLGEYDEPRKACFSLLSFAQEFISHFQPAKEYPLPADGYISFYFLTIHGVLTATAKQSDLENKRIPLSPLFYKAQEVITGARRVDEKRQKEFKELMNAATTGDLSKVNALIARGANLTAADSSGLTALMAASYNGNMEIVNQLVKAGVPIDAKDESGYTALMYSCNKGKLSCARFLIDNGANVNEADNDDSTPLMFAAQHGYNEIVRLLLGNGADPARTGSHGLSAIGFAKQNGLVETEKILKGMA
jgi:hypothetical protein